MYTKSIWKPRSIKNAFCKRFSQTEKYKQVSWNWCVFFLTVNSYFSLAPSFPQGLENITLKALKNCQRESGLSFVNALTDGTEGEPWQQQEIKRHPEIKIEVNYSTYRFFPRPDSWCSTKKKSSQHNFNMTMPSPHLSLFLGTGEGQDLKIFLSLKLSGRTWGYLRRLHLWLVTENWSRMILLMSK